MRASDAGLYFRLEPKSLYLYGGETCCGARDSLRRGLSSLVTNELVMIIEVKALGQWIGVSSFVGLLALWRVRTLAHGAIVAICVYWTYRWRVMSS